MSGENVTQENVIVIHATSTGDVLVENAKGVQYFVSIDNVFPLPPRPQTTLTEQQHESLKKAIYNVIMNSNDELGMADMGECELLAENTVKTWAEQNHIKLP